MASNIFPKSNSLIKIAAVLGGVILLILIFIILTMLGVANAEDFLYLFK